MEGNFTKINVFMNVKNWENINSIDLEWYETLSVLHAGLFRVVLLGPDYGNLHESAQGLPPRTSLQVDAVKEIGESVALQDQFEDILWGKAWLILCGFRWWLWDAIFGCTSLSLHFLMVINIGNLIDKISKGILYRGGFCSIGSNWIPLPPSPFFAFCTSWGNSHFASRPQNPFVWSVNIIMFHRGISYFLLTEPVVIDKHM